MPVGLTVSVVEVFFRMVLFAGCANDGSVLTVTAALPLEVPLQFASLIEATVYVVVDDGETVREAVVPPATF